MLKTPTTSLAPTEKIETLNQIPLCHFTWEEKIKQKQGETLAYSRLLETEKRNIDKLSSKTFKTTNDETSLAEAQQRYLQIQTKVEMLKVAQEIFEFLTEAHKNYQQAFLKEAHQKGTGVEEAQKALLTLNQAVNGVLDKLIHSVFETRIKTFLLITELPGELRTHLDKKRFQERASALIQLLNNYNKSCLFKKAQAQRTNQVLNDQLSFLTISNPLFAKMPAKAHENVVHSRERSLSQVEESSKEETQTSSLKRTLSSLHNKK